MLKLKKETYIWAKHANLLLFWHQPTNKILFCYTKSTSTQSPLLAAVLTAGGPQRWVALFGSRDAAAITKQLPYYFTKLLY